MCRKDLAAYPMVKVAMIGNNGEEVFTLRRSAIAVVLMSGFTTEDAIFSVGEALCNPHDVFNKALGRKIAIARATHGDNEGAVQYRLEDIERMVKYEDLDDPMSDATAPLSGAPMPYGIVNRIKMLIPRPEE